MKKCSFLLSTILFFFFSAASKITISALFVVEMRADSWNDLPYALVGL